MRIIDFAELHKIDFSVLRITPLYQLWRNSDSYTYKERPHNGLMYFTNCETVYSVKERPEFLAKRGDIAYIPYKSSYTCRFRNCTPNPANWSAYLINFELYDEQGQPFILDSSIKLITPKSTSYYYESFQQIVSLFYISNISYSRIKAMFYNLLTDLSMELHKENIRKQRFASIYKGIIHLEQNFKSNISVAKLAEICHVSETCFRRLFKEYSGMSPKEYAIHQKISKARVLLENGYASVADVAASLGFDDPSYFSRLYKKKTGTSPKSVKK